MKGNIIVKNASQLVTCSGFEAKKGSQMSELHIIEDAALIIEEGLITKVGKSRDILNGVAEEDFDVVDARGKAVLPGFVDSHTHLVFGGYRAEEFILRLSGASYMEIMSSGGGIVRTVEATRKASHEELFDSGRRRLDSMLSFGITTVEGKSGYGLDRDTEIRQLEVMKDLDQSHPVDIVRTFLGAHAVPQEFKNRTDEYLDSMMSFVLPEVAERKLAEFCDVFCEKDVFSIEQSKRLLLEARKLGMKLTLHADEVVRLGGAELAAELNAFSAAHLLHASDQGIADLAESAVVATLLPITAFSLREPYARARYMIDQGCAVALATDLNPGSCFSESIPLLVTLATLSMNMSVEETITAITINGAAALGRAHSIGSIDRGKRGDVIILEFPSYQYIPYHIGVNTVEKVVKGGRLVYDKTEGGRL